MAFMRFLRVAASRTGQLLNFASMARDVDVDLKTAQSWLSILEASGLIYLLQPYHNNITNRMIKTPSLYFYRDREQKEIDLLIEQDGYLYPVEFKKSASPSLYATKHFSALQKLGVPIGHGAVLCLRETDVPLSQEVTAIPVGYL